MARWKVEVQYHRSSCTVHESELNIEICLLKYLRKLVCIWQVKGVQGQMIDCRAHRTCTGGRQLICRCPDRGSLGNPDTRLPFPGLAPPQRLGTTTPTPTPTPDVSGSGSGTPPTEATTTRGPTGLEALNARPVMCASIPCCTCDYLPGFAPRGRRK